MGPSLYVGVTKALNVGDSGPFDSEELKDQAGSFIQYLE